EKTMLFPGKYWAAYWRLIKVSAAMAATGLLSWVALAWMELYEGYAELVLATVIFAPVGIVLLLHGLGIVYAVLLRVGASIKQRDNPVPSGTVGGVALIAFVFLLSGLFFTILSVQSILAIAT